MPDNVTSELADGVLTVTLNRPERLNAWTYEMGDAYFELLDRAEDDTAVRAVILTGAGRAFCAGLDFDALGAASQGGPLQEPAAGRRMTHAQGFRKPLIGAVNGPCVGFGLVQALACDVMFAAESAYFVTAFSQRGLNAEYGTSWLLPRIIGQTRAAEWLFSGRRMAADEAERIGLVNGVHPDGELLAQVTDYTRNLVANSSPTAVADSKSQVREDWSRTLVDAEDHAKTLGRSPGHRIDFAEGVRSFVERRVPMFAPLPPRDEATQ